MGTNQSSRANSNPGAPQVEGSTLPESMRGLKSIIDTTAEEQHVVSTDEEDTSEEESLYDEESEDEDVYDSDEEGESY